MVEAAQFGREGKAPWVFAGASAEISRACPLADGEKVLLHGVGRRRKAWRLPRPVLMRVSPPRLVALYHYAFQSDRVLELPRGAVCEVLARGGVVRIAWRRRDATIATLAVGPWSGPSRMDWPLPRPAELAYQLNAWLSTGSVHTEGPEGSSPTLGGLEILGDA